jgi:hypothetical protein
MRSEDLGKSMSGRVAVSGRLVLSPSRLVLSPSRMVALLGRWGGRCHLREVGGVGEGRAGVVVLLPLSGLDRWVGTSSGRDCDRLFGPLLPSVRGKSNLGTRCK